MCFDNPSPGSTDHPCNRTIGAASTGPTYLRRLTAPEVIMGSMAPSEDEIYSSDSAGRRVPKDAEVAARLAMLVTRLQGRSGDSAVSKQPLVGVAGVATRLTPPTAGSCDASLP